MKKKYELNQNEVSKLIDDSDRNLDKILVTIDNINEVGAKTITALNEQGEQFEEIEKVHKEILETIVHAENVLDEIERGFFGKIAEFFKRAFMSFLQFFTPDEKKETYIVERKTHVELKVSITIDSSALILSKIRNKEIAKSLHLSEEDSKKLDRIDQNLVLASHKLDELYEQALVMGQILDAQNHKLDTLVNVSDKNQIAMEHVTYRTRGIN